MDPTGEQQPDLAELAREGVEQCRKGSWEPGFRTLCQVANADREKVKLPSVFYSYLGVGMARFEKRYDDAEKLCQRALEIEFYEADNYANLAKVYQMRGKRLLVFETVTKGLQVDASHPELLAQRAELGYRRKPVLGFLPREHALNRVLGKLRHRMLGGGKAKSEKPSAAGRAEAARRPARKS